MYKQNDEPKGSTRDPGFYPIAEADSVLLKSETGAVLMDLHRFTRENKYMVIEGILIGSWESRIYIDYEHAFRMLRKLLTWEMIGYMLLVPYWMIKNRFKKRKQAVKTPDLPDL